MSEEFYTFPDLLNVLSLLSFDNMRSPLSIWRSEALLISRSGLTDYLAFISIFIAGTDSLPNHGNNKCHNIDVPVAQLDRASDS